MTTVSKVILQVVATEESERGRAVALHDYVRDKVRFGFNRYFDAAEPDFTLSFAAGHCNPKSKLMVELFREAGLEAHQHFAVIPRDILEGVIPAAMWWLIPEQINHSFVEVKVDGQWCSIDSFIVDTPLLKAAHAILAVEGRSLGYGTRIGSTNTWDGQSQAFSQFNFEVMIEDLGRVDDLEAFFRSPKYRHKVLGVRFNTTFNIMGERIVKMMNSHIDQLRRRG